MCNEYVYGSTSRVPLRRRQLGAMAQRPANGTAEPARVGVVIAVGLTSVVD